MQCVEALFTTLPRAFVLSDPRLELRVRLSARHSTRRHGTFRAFVGDPGRQLMESARPNDDRESAPTTDVVKQALGEVRELVQLDLRLAKQELREDLLQMKRATIAGGAAFVLGLARARWARRRRDSRPGGLGGRRAEGCGDPARARRNRRGARLGGQSVKRHKTLLIGVGAGVLVAAALITVVRRRSANHPPGYLRWQAMHSLLGPGYVIESVERRDRGVLGSLAKAAIGLALRMAKEKWLDTRRGRPDARGRRLT